MDDHSKSFELPTVTGDPSGDKFLGTTVDGRYRIERELGHGGVGTVYLARDLKLHDKPVVVKVLLEKSLRDDWIVRKFQQEKEAMTRVDHPGVVGILDTGELPDGKPYIIMQYVDGVSLREPITAKPDGMELERVASIVRQAGAALSAVHEKKTYHRDLKPENIMLQKLARGDEQVKIVDFGIAKVKESVVAPSTITGAATAGTIVYMSPEQLRGERVGAASDIYALGVIAYEMVTGRRPFNPDTAVHLSDLQRQGVRVKPIDLRPRLPNEAQAIILKALSLDPKARYQDAAEFGDALARALMNEEETLRQHRVPQRTQLSVETPPAPLPTAASAKTLVTPFEPARVSKQDQPIPLPFEPDTKKGSWPKLVIGLVLVAALAVGGYVVIAKRQTLFGGGVTASPANPPANPVAQRSLSYWLTVQKMRDGKPYKEPFESSGLEIFENGYKFRLNTSSPQPGYLYVFNEGTEKDVSSFTIIYPTPATNNGSAKLAANQNVQTNWNTFQGQAGTEEFWIVWSAAPVTELEAARDAAFKSGEGAVGDPAMVRVVKEFLIKHSEPKPETTKDTTKQQTSIRANSDLLVKQVELEHR